MEVITGIVSGIIVLGIGYNTIRNNRKILEVQKKIRGYESLYKKHLEANK